MQAIIFEQAGRAEEVLAVRDMPSPVPGRGQVLIQVAARPIQPADFLFIEGRYRIKPAFPQVAGLEGVGTITVCGPEVTGFEPGTHVAFRAPGAWAEFVVAPLSRVYPVPTEISDAVACQFALNPLTAWGLLSECDLPKSSRLLITAGRSVVTRLLTKLARRQGLHASLLVRDGEGYAVLEGDTGQTIASGKSVAEALQTVVDNQGRFHAILDAVGGANTLALIDALEPRGRLISYGILDDGEITLKASRILYKNMTWQGFGIDGWLDHASQETLTAAQQELWPMLTEHPDLLPVIGRFTLSQVQEAVHAVRTIKRPGKVLLMG
ncbi:MAG: alcohol dehydrogenase catalytic domain-containing protein [Gammaproteobacteria bacterium]|nr:alcohol dehydrogenase catalytic domain-containing protein [Gammaproteobacteria bacterium]